MCSKLEFSIALRYLRAKRKEGFASLVAVFSFIGIMLGVATLIVTMAVMNGVRTELINRIIGINAHISVGSPDGRIENFRLITQNIKHIEGVKRANPAIYGQSLASVNGANIGLVVRGVDSVDLMGKDMIKNNIIAGHVYNEGAFETLVGIELARKLGLTEGTKISLISPSFNQTLFGSIPRLKEFRVNGVFDVGMYEYDASVIFIPLDVAQKFFSLGDSVSTIEIEVNDPKNLDDIKDEVFKTLEGTDYYITDWREANAGFLESIDVQANVLFLILALIILVAAFNVISGMVMLVNDKNKEVAILRTIGMKRRSVMWIFTICGSAIGFLGTAFGVVLGLSFAANIESIRLWLEGLTNTNLFAAEIYFLSKLPAEVRMDDVIHIVALSLGLSLLSTLYPAWKASKIQPAEALKYE
jgi:lipoprotein-releasing system permease protein